MKKAGIMVFLSFFFISMDRLDACTRLFMNNNDLRVVGRTFDWDTHYNETLRIMPRGQLHRGESAENELSWVSIYGSIVIQENFQGQRAITDGVNEAGLAAHLLAFEEGEYEPRDLSKPSLSILQWLQYYLDNFATVEEVLKHTAEVQIVPADFADLHGLPLHVALEDSSGDSAIIEFVKGQLKVYHDKAYTTLTNDPDFSSQLINWSKYESQHCPRAEMPLDDESTSRFVRATCYLQALPTPKSSDQAVALVASIIENVSIPYGLSQTEVTWWRTIIDFSQHRYYFKSTQVPALFWLDYSQIDFGQINSYPEIKVHDNRWQGDLTSYFTTSRN